MPSAPVRECGCPEWARCVHFDRHVLWLADTAKVSYKSKFPVPGRYKVGIGTEVRFDTDTGILNLFGDTRDPEMLMRLADVFDTDDPAEANAAFGRRAEALRLGEDGP